MERERPDYGNWVAKGLAYGLVAATAALVAATIAVAALMPAGMGKTVLVVLLILGIMGAGKCAQWCFMARAGFSYDGDVQLSRRIVEGVASRISVPRGGTCLDVGCGSGALTIEVAKRNPRATVVGCDRWGAGYEFSRDLCERNAQAEGVRNVRFVEGDATRLPFDDESFDVVTSNYVYHNITGANKQDLLLETLRCLKRGGTFCIHDLMSPRRYGDMQAFAQRLRDMGYRHVELIDTTNGPMMSRAESRRYMLIGSTILTGRK